MRCCSKSLCKSLSFFRRGYEMLLRKLLAFKQKPAVIALHSWSPFFNHPKFFNTTEDLIQVLVLYYGLQSVSVRNSLWHPTWQRRQNFQGKQWLCDSIHPNTLGHRYCSYTTHPVAWPQGVQYAKHAPYAALCFAMSCTAFTLCILPCSVLPHAVLCNACTFCSVMQCMHICVLPCSVCTLCRTRLCMHLV